MARERSCCGGDLNVLLLDNVGGSAAALLGPSGYMRIGRMSKVLDPPRGDRHGVIEDDHTDTPRLVRHEAIHQPEDALDRPVPGDGGRLRRAR